ncbi:hypothetical protein OQA88_1469 [Cercophora sp. LCS_1]
MPLKRYGVWKAKPLDWKGDAAPDHGYLRFTDNANGTYEAAVNVKSKSSDSRLVYWLDALSNGLSLIQDITALEYGFHPAGAGAGSLGPDYLRGGFLDIQKGTLVSHDAPNERHDALDYLDPVFRQAIDVNADVYIFGQRYHDEGKSGKDGMHDIHMNQGNSGEWKDDNGTYQDGGILLHFAATDEQAEHWQGVFLAFAVQACKTDDNGDPADGADTFATLLGGEGDKVGGKAR